MNYTIPTNELPVEVEVTAQLTPEEKNKPIDPDALYSINSKDESRPSVHEKLAKNNREKTKKKSYKKILKERFKKPIRRGDKIQNLKKKNKKK